MELAKERHILKWQQKSQLHLRAEKLNENAKVNGMVDNGKRRKLRGAESFGNWAIRKKIWELQRKKGKTENKRQR